jgi:hypothetical protein
MTKIELNLDAVAARKDWLVNNSRCCEVLESEFFYQLTPSLDFGMYDIDQDFLKTRQIKAIKFAKPDSRYLSCASIGFNEPSVLENGEWRKRYA